MVTNSVIGYQYILGGIPQGSTLGPLLFLLHVNQMPSQVSSLLQFADYTCLIYSAESPTAVIKLLQDDLNALSQWIVLSKMRLIFKNQMSCGSVLNHLFLSFRDSL